MPGEAPLTGSLEWVDDWLVLTCGPWRFAVADIEVFSDGTAMAHLTGWMHAERGRIARDADTVIANDEHGDDHAEPLNRCDIPCRDRAEALAVVAALLAVRGIRVPEAP